MRKIRYILLVLLGTIAFSGTLQAQIGGQFTPLQYSDHTYMIKMGNLDNATVWGVYVDGTSASDIENNVAVAATGFQFINSWTVGDVAYYNIQFGIGTTGMATGSYVIGYKETTTLDENLCLKAVVEPLVLYDAFDVDVVLNRGAIDATRCPDDSGVWKESDVSSTTTIEYRVFIEYPDDLAGGYISTGGKENWSFKFKIETSGIGGADATIARVTVAEVAPDVLSSPPTYTVPANSTSFEETMLVAPSSITPLIFTVEYNDVLSVSQDVSFSIHTILGAYDGPDIDEVKGTQANNNIVTHEIYALPNVSDITAWGP